MRFVDVIEVAPIGVYTSGKGSSAAGLTASVVRDPGTVRFPLASKSKLIISTARILPRRRCNGPSGRRHSLH